MRFNEFLSQVVSETVSEGDGSMSCKPLDPNGELCPDDYCSILEQEERDRERERLYPSTAPTDDEHRVAMIRGTYPTRLEALSEGLRGLLDG